MRPGPRCRRAARRALALTLLAGSVCACAATTGGGASPAPESAAATQTDRPVPLVVALVVDQLPAWVADERWPLLGGGFGRLLREGTWVHQLTYLHATTETAPGHAALFTGAPPHENGITTNSVGAAARGSGPSGPPVSALEDPAHRLVGPVPKASPGMK